MSEQPIIILPDAGKGLLRQELAYAFSRLGFVVHRVAPQHLANAHHEQYLGNYLANGPALLLSINMQGLEDIPGTLSLLNKANSKALVWFVDNPWNVLSAVRHKEWRNIPLCVVDPSFVPALQKNGATKVMHLPLAACEVSFLPNAQRDAAFLPPHNLAPFVFVGRSAFPCKEEFFDGVECSSRLMEQATLLMNAGQRPTLGWWQKQLMLDAHSMWPGKKSRLAALGAEECSLLWRAQCLQQAATLGAELRGATHSAEGAGLDVFGDDGWQPLLPANARLLSPVDYYAKLPSIYGAARYSLCLTSMQLPQGLNQRHFDVWMAGGVCLSDATDGLELFPLELTSLMSFSGVAEMVRKVMRLEAHPQLRSNLISAWKQYLLEHHTYTHRVQAMLRFLQIL